MANHPSAVKSNPDNLYSILVVICGLVIGYILYSNSFFPLTPEAINPPAIPPDTDVMARFDALKLDFSVFDNMAFKELKIFGDIPVTPGVTGKTDPFSP